MRLLLTGADGFTGRHLRHTAEAAGYSVYSLRSDLNDSLGVADEVGSISPTCVIHLAAISAVTHADELAFYQVNLFGTLNLLKALSRLKSPPQKVLLASSANVYGNQDGKAISERVCPKPVSHYAISKLAMEHMAATYSNRLPIIITRPFNYTGVGHDLRFVIPTIIDHFVRKSPVIELGNLDVYREYNDVRMLCDIYLKLLASGACNETYNVCTGKAYALRDVLDVAQQITGHKLSVSVNPAFVRANEVHWLAGDPGKLKSVIGDLKPYTLEETLSWMLAEA